MAWKYGSYKIPANLKEKEQKRIAKSNAQKLKSTTPYKNPIFPTHKETITLTTKSGKPKKVEVDMQNVELEKAVRQAMRSYGIWSHSQETSQGSVHRNKASKLFREGGEESVINWLNTLNAKASNKARTQNSQDLLITLEQWERWTDFVFEEYYNELYHGIKNSYAGAMGIHSVDDLYDALIGAIDSVRERIYSESYTFDEKNMIRDNLQAKGGTNPSEELIDYSSPEEAVNFICDVINLLS